MKKNTEHLDVICYKEDGEYVAHCLQMDLVAVADTVDQAFGDIAAIIKAQIAFAQEHNNLENIFTPAPKEYWIKKTTLLKMVSEDAKIR